MSEPEGGRAGCGGVLENLAPSVEWPVTLCVLLYGDHPELARRFFERLRRHTPLALVRVRVGMNAVCHETRETVGDFCSAAPGTLVVDSPVNLFKNRMMQRLFWDRPLETRWTLWFDDDSYVRRDDWLQALALRIEGEPDTAMFGRLLAVWPDERVLGFARGASWFRGRDFELAPFEDRGPSPVFRFVEGGFWAVRTAALEQIDWPDERLVHYYDDFIMGEALRQNRLAMGWHTSGVEISDSPRRGPLDGRSGI